MQIRLKPSRVLFLLAVFALSTFAVIPQDDEDAVVAERHYKRGQKLYRAGQTEQAIEELYSALSVREIYYEAQLLLGRALLEAKRYHEAAATLREIEPPERGAAEVHKLLGRAYYEMNRLREAARNFQYAIGFSKRPDYELHYWLGLVMLRQGATGAAIDEAARAVALKPYLASVRDRAEAAEIKERIKAMRSLGRAKPQKSVQKQITLPRIYNIPHPGY